MPEYILTHQIEYTTDKPVPISEIVDALVGLERIIKRTPQVLEAIFPNTYISNVEVQLTKLQSGSLYEDFVIKFVFGSQKEFDIFVKSLREKCGMDLLMENKKLVPVILLALILGGGYLAIKKSGGDPKKVYQIEANHNTIINIGASMVEIPPDKFRSIIETVVKADTKLASDAVSVIKPAKQYQNAEIVFDKSQELKITSDTITSVPDYLYQEDEEAEHFEDLKDVSLELRAMDLDHKRQGWAAVVPDFSKERARLQIDALIDLESLKGKTKLKGDVTLVWLVAQDSKRTLKRIVLRELKEAIE